MSAALKLVLKQAAVKTAAVPHFLTTFAPKLREATPLREAPRAQENAGPAWKADVDAIDPAAPDAESRFNAVYGKHPTGRGDLSRYWMQRQQAANGVRPAHKRPRAYSPFAPGTGTPSYGTYQSRMWRGVNPVNSIANAVDRRVQETLGEGGPVRGLVRETLGEGGPVQGLIDRTLKSRLTRFDDLMSQGEKTLSSVRGLTDNPLGRLFGGVGGWAKKNPWTAGMGGLGVLLLLRQLFGGGQGGGGLGGLILPLLLMGGAYAQNKHNFMQPVTNWVTNQFPATGAASARNATAQ